jgi:outer membrane protein assembly factor BamB
MNPKTALSLHKTVLICGVLAVISIGCQRTGLAPSPPVSPPPSLTSHDTTKTTTVSAPIDTVVTIYVGRGTSLWAVNAQTGAIKWSTPLGDLVGNSPLFYQGKIYIATGFQAGNALHALDTNGNVLWSAPLSGGLDISPSDAYGYNGMVFVCGQLYSPPVAVDANTGAIRWTFPTASLNPSGTGGGNIALTDSVLYFSDFDYLSAIDANSGQIIWQVQHQTTKLPGVTGGKVILGDIDASAEALDRQTTAVLWRTTPPPSWPDVEVQSVNTAFGNAYVYLGGTVNVLDTATGATKSIIGIGGPGGGGVAHSTDSNLFVSAYAGNLYCANLNTGAQEWDLALYPFNGYTTVLSGASSLNNIVYYNYDYLYARNVTSQQIIWKTPLENNDGWSYSTPCLVTKSGKVYRGGNNF